jgi:hypothetical protein
MEPKPYALTPYLQVTIAACALTVAVCAGLLTYHAWSSDRNARLVEIGISVLRADPKKEPSTAAARGWALDLIDANAGGVRFSAEARQRLLEEPLEIVDTYWSDWKYTEDTTPKKNSK